MTIEFKILDKKLYSKDNLKPQTAGSAGIDLKMSYILTDKEEDVFIIHTGLAVFIGDNSKVGLIFARSSCPFQLLNAVAVIDSDYQGELILRGRPLKPINSGDRIAQLVIMPVCSVTTNETTWWLDKINIVEEFSTSTVRGDAGFGSTGC